jgi:hypothetical protein
MLSSLSKLADRNFVVGFFLPALLALVASAWAFPGVEALAPLRTLSATGKSLTDLVYLALVVWAAALVLAMANHTLYRLLEGYLPPMSWLWPLYAWHRWRFRRLRSKLDEVDGERAKLAAQVPRSEKEKAAQAARSMALARRAGRLFTKSLTRYPTFEAEVLPTKFGNAVKAFEVYPRQAYGADSIPIWPRLASVGPQDFAGHIAEARANVDCFVNLAVLSFALALIALGHVAAQNAWGLLPSGNRLTFSSVEAFAETAPGRSAAVALCGLIFFFVFYHWATARVGIWGELVKSAFDCYLPALAKQLGYELPESEADRRLFWGEVGRLAQYQLPTTPGRWARAVEATGSESAASKSKKEDGGNKTDEDEGEEHPQE